MRCPTGSWISGNARTATTLQPLTTTRRPSSPGAWSSSGRTAPRGTGPPGLARLERERKVAGQREVARREPRAVARGAAVRGGKDVTGEGASGGGDGRRGWQERARRGARHGAADA